MRWRAVGFLAAAVVLAFSGRAEQRFLGVERQRIERVIELGYNLSDETGAEIAALRAEHPDSPVPDLLEAGRLYWYQNYAEWDSELRESFEEAAEESLEKAKRYAKRHRDDPEAEFAVAMNEVVLLMYYVDERRWWAAFWKARSSFKTLRQLLEDHPDLHDAKLPLGIAYCYSAETPGYLKPLAFLLKFKGDLEQGLTYVREAKRGGLFLRVDAAYHLGMIEKELQENPQAAKREFAALVEEFPRNGRFHNMLAQMERATGEAGQAVERLSRLLELAVLERFPGMRIRSLSSLCWSALAAQRFALALETAEEAKRVMSRDERIPDDLEWVTMAEAEALRGLSRDEEALDRFRSISRSNDHLYRTAQERIREIERALEGDSLEDQESVQ